MLGRWDILGPKNKDSCVWANGNIRIPCAKTKSVGAGPQAQDRST